MVDFPPSSLKGTFQSYIAISRSLFFFSLALLPTLNLTSSHRLVSSYTGGQPLNFKHYFALHSHLDLLA